MAGEKYAHKAVTSLLAYAQSNFTTHLRAVETAEGLGANTLTNPIEYIGARIPKDNRAHVFRVFCERSEEYEKERDLHVNDCVMAMEFLGGNDIEADQADAQRYETAMTLLINADRTLSNTVVHAIPTDSDSASAKISDAESRYAIAMGVEVVTWDG